MDESIDAFRKTFSACCRNAISRVRNEQADETFYAHALVFSDDMCWFTFCASSNESFAKEKERWLSSESNELREHAKEDIPALLRWNPGNWGYDGVCDRELEPANELAASLRANAQLQEEVDYLRFDGELLGVVATEIAKLVRENFINVDETVFLHAYDSGDVQWLEIESARVINTPANFERFKDGWSRRWKHLVNAGYLANQNAGDESNPAYSAFKGVTQ